MEVVSHLLVFLWLISLYVLGIWMFGGGFLLKRNELELKSDCKHVPKSNILSLEGSNTTCWFPTKFNRSIIIIIDALRYDFTRPSKVDNLYYRNKFLIFEEKFQEGNGFLFEFRAHPPTTTLQRLKGLTTGSLPTFIDVSSNFASSEITEDNLVYQLVQNGKKIVFMGDDTWEGLFPNAFHRSYAFPSFNVKDLHTVDNGISEHLLPEMKKPDWDVIIAHFLGVDHCGHLYGPSHPVMADKLSQMNEIIRSVIKNVENDTVLFVFGDHGMTRTGDHGGDSDDETSSALFVYNPTFNNKHSSIEYMQSVTQVDLVPTFALIMGIPIPFSNLGSIITPLLHPLLQEDTFLKYNFLEFGIKKQLFLLYALSINSHQIHRYLLAYSKQSNEISEATIEACHDKLKHLNSLWRELEINILQHANATRRYQLIEELREGYVTFLHHAQNVCESIWAKFDVFSMTQGLFILICAVVFNGLLIVMLPSVKFWPLLPKGMIIMIMVITAIILLSVCNIISNRDAIHAGIFAYALASLLILATPLLCAANWYQLCRSLNYADKIAMLITLCIFCTLFSNSFIVYESAISVYFLLTMLTVTLLPGVIKQCASILKTKSIYHVLWHPALMFLLLTSVRLGRIFFKCREEEWPCTSSTFLIPLFGLPPELESYRTPRLVLSCSALAFITIGLWCFFYYNNRLNTYSAATLCSQYGLPMATICTCFHWTLGLVPPHVISHLIQKRQDLLPQTALGLCTIVIIVLYLSPLLVAEEHTLAGIGTLLVESSYSVGLLSFSMLQIIYLLAGDGLSPAVSLLVASAMIYLYLLSSCQTSEDYSSPAWHVVVTWNLFVSYGFFATGHQYTFPAIHWHAAFVITSESVSNLLSAIFVVLNTFSAHILFGISLSLLLTLPEAFSSLSEKRKSYKVNLRSFRVPLLNVVLKYLLFCGIKLLGAATACLLLRRHLMVWKIFAPRLMFETIGFFVSVFSVICGYIFVLLLQRSFHKLVLKLSQHSWS